MSLVVKLNLREFRNYLGGLLGESERKNISQISKNPVGASDHKLHHFITDSPWSVSRVNERRLEIMKLCRQTKHRKKFNLIVDDTGHRKSGIVTEGVGRQYIGEVGKTDNGLVMVTTHRWGKKFTIRFCSIFTCRFFRERKRRSRIQEKTRVGFRTN